MTNDLNDIIPVCITLSRDVSLRELFVAARDCLLINFNTLPSKDDVLDWVKYDMSEDDVANNLWYDVDIVEESDLQEILLMYIDDFYEYVKETYI